MRHRKKTVILGRKRGPRRALLSSLATSVILYERVTTTEAKAKAVRPMIERLVTKGKVNSLHVKRELNSTRIEKKAVKKILDVLGPRYKDRSGGYLRIIKQGQRQGDAAPIVTIEFV